MIWPSVQEFFRSFSRQQDDLGMGQGIFRQDTDAETKSGRLVAVCQARTIVQQLLHVSRVEANQQRKPAVRSLKRLYHP